MIRNDSSIMRKILLIAVLTVIAIGGIFYLTRDKKEQVTAAPGLYVNFGGNYTFKVPSNHTVDEQSVPGAQLVYSGKIEARTVEDIYNSNGIAVQPLADLTDHSAKAFKEYVDKKFVPDLKKNLSVEDVKVEFGKTNNVDTARITAKKDGSIIRFVFLRAGQHPAQVVAKTETDSTKVISQSLIDIESSEAKAEVEPLKAAMKSIAQLITTQKAKELYEVAAPELKSASTQDELAKALKTAAPFTSGNVDISGGSYTPESFTAAMRFTKADKPNDPPGIGSMVLKKIDGQWKLALLSLPSPTP